jgi:calcineurin-like phosphoesterase family protein
MEAKLIYKCEGFRNGELIYNEDRTMNFDDLLLHFEFYHSQGKTMKERINHMIERWNSQPESKITGLKWKYEVLYIF